MPLHLGAAQAAEQSKESLFRLTVRDDRCDRLLAGKQPHAIRVFCRRGAGNRLFPKKSGFPAAFVVNRSG
jgi:hypothetical protein